MSIIKKGQYSIRDDVYHSILKASDKYDVPFAYMLAIAAKESNFDPNAKATTSSATGLYQFIKRTWEEMWKDSKVKPLATDPNANADAGARFTKQIQNKLNTNDFGKLYLGHFLGISGAINLLSYLDKDPDILVDIIIENSQLKANKSVFYNKDGTYKTVKDVYDWSKNSINKIVLKLGV
jgi:hypothetical protein